MRCLLLASWVFEVALTVSTCLQEDFDIGSPHLSSLQSRSRDSFRHHCSLRYAKRWLFYYFLRFLLQAAAWRHSLHVRYIPPSQASLRSIWSVMPLANVDMACRYSGFMNGSRSVRVSARDMLFYRYGPAMTIYPRHGRASWGRADFSLISCCSSTGGIVISSIAAAFNYRDAFPLLMITERQE